MGLGFTLSDLITAPEVNPINGKARKIPVLNVVNVHGRVFFFSWFGFMISFWAWYTFPPLVRNITLELRDTRRRDCYLLTYCVHS